MIELGKKQTLTVVNQREHGVYLGERADAGIDERVLLPKKYVPEGTEIGSTIEVFIYRDSSDRLVATTEEPALRLGETAFLKVKQVTKIGAFLDWGLEKDLLLPFHEQTKKVNDGETVLAALYIDKSSRLAATMNVYPYLSKNSPYHAGDEVEGYIYQYAHNFGMFVAVDGKYSGMIPIREVTGRLHVGDTMTLRVTNVKKDGKLDLTAGKKAYLQMDDDAEAVTSVIRDEFGGVLPFDDKADPERIREVFGLSKAAFKRAVGRLYKERKISIENGTIELK